MSGPIEFLRARLDEDERYARTALSSPESSNSGSGVRVIDGSLAIRPSAMSEALALHSSRNSPARVLREVQAKRAILARYEDCLARQHDNPAALFEQVREYEDVVLPHLLAVYSDHPDYRQEWKP